MKLQIRIAKSTADFIINKKKFKEQGVFISSLCLEVDCCSGYS